MTEKMQETGPTVNRPYPRTLKVSLNPVVIAKAALFTEDPEYWYGQDYSNFRTLTQLSASLRKKTSVILISRSVDSYEKFYCNFDKSNSATGTLVIPPFRELKLRNAQRERTTTLFQIKGPPKWQIRQASLSRNTISVICLLGGPTRC